MSLIGHDCIRLNPNGIQASDISGSWLQRLESSERQGTQGLARIKLFKRRHIGAFPPITKSHPQKKGTSPLTSLHVAQPKQPKAWGFVCCGFSPTKKKPTSQQISESPFTVSRHRNGETSRAQPRQVRTVTLAGNRFTNPWKISGEKSLKLKF